MTQSEKLETDFLLSTVELWSCKRSEIFNFTWKQPEIFQVLLQPLTKHYSKYYCCTKQYTTLGKWIKSRSSLIVRVNVVLNRTLVVDSDWRFDNLCGSHLQSQSELYHVSWWYYTLSTTIVLFRTTFTRTIKLNLLLKWLLAWVVQTFPWTTNS